jgi:uncharacterized protein YceH (UPF0502 family)
MEPQTQAETPGRSGPWPTLDLPQRRVLGVLVEKAKTTPDAYPMSINALVTGCNQKSNRDPVLNLSEEEVEEALRRCQPGGLVMRITGSRVERWRHLLYEAWHVDKVDLAVLAELLLRGPQTEGELRTRASRMEPIEDLDRLRSLLRNLAERKLVVYLTPEERRGTVVTHGFHDPRELQGLRAHHVSAAAALETASAPPPAPRPAAPSAAEQRLPALEAALAEARAEIDGLKRQTAQLQSQLASVVDELRQLKQSLGV